ncbi:terpene cyclase/mutase family protein [bacterium]|nr:terpene cyclase/mutase family protein [bacterium]
MITICCWALCGLLGDDSPEWTEHRALARPLVEKATAYYRGVQADDGSFAEGDYGPAVTALVVTGLLRNKIVPPSDAMVVRGLDFLRKHAQPDGGIYVPGPNRNYPTAIALLAFHEANADGKYQGLIDQAIAFLKKDQWDQGEGADPSNPKFGGAGYGAKSRPDLSNTAYFLEALEAAGVPKDDPAYQRALTFISRCQNLSGEGANDLAQGALIDDGGFYYTPAEAYNPGGIEANGGLRSYASMTYAGLKSFIHAGLKKDDRRVQAAWKWIQQHYTLDENPGLGQMGLFYYYQTFAKALDILEIDQFESSDGSKHDWRKDLLTALAARQKEDGSWSNPEKRWLESDGRLVTAYALLAISHATR